MALVCKKKKDFRGDCADWPKGNYNCNATEPCVPAKDRKPLFSKTFQKGKRYLIRLINASTASSLIFSIDNHWLEIVTADFVPIHPFKNESIQLAIGEHWDPFESISWFFLGQRYTVIVEAKPSAPVQADGNYWIRTLLGNGCGAFSNPYDNRTGIIRYDPKSVTSPNSTLANINQTCADAPLKSLVPVVPWAVDTHAVNNVNKDTYEADLDTVQTHGYIRWDLTDTPMWWAMPSPHQLTLLVASNGSLTLSVGLIFQTPRF